MRVWVSLEMSRRQTSFNREKRNFCGLFKGSEKMENKPQAYFADVLTLSYCARCFYSVSVASQRVNSTIKQRSGHMLKIKKKSFHYPAWVIL